MRDQALLKLGSRTGCEKSGLAEKEKVSGEGKGVRNLFSHEKEKVSGTFSEGKGVRNLFSHGSLPAPSTTPAPGRA
jgi:hypothetical protein